MSIHGHGERERTPSATALLRTEEEESLSGANVNALNEEDPERDRATNFKLKTCVGREEEEF